MNVFKDALREAVYSPLLFPIIYQYKCTKGQTELQRKLLLGRDLLEDLDPALRHEWEERIQDVCQCPDNAALPRVPDAGKIVCGHLVMHNGIKVHPLSYDGYPMLKLLMANRGAHEPQVEKAFQAVLQALDSQPKTCVELGANWSFYSLWFLQRFPTARCLMVEPRPGNLLSGKRNFALNQRHGTFVQSFIGAADNPAEHTLTLDSLCATQNIGFVDLLHADIQGSELHMLYGAKRLLKQNRIGYIFIGTHSPQLHQDCENFLTQEFGFSTVASADCSETYSVDGILVMKAPDYSGLDRVPLSAKSSGPDIRSLVTKSAGHSS